MFLTVQGEKVVRERLDVTNNVRGKGSFGRDVMLQTVLGGMWSFGRDMILHTVKGGIGLWRGM